MYAAVYCMISIYNRRYIHPYINIYLRYTHDIHTCTRMYVCASGHVCVCIRVCVSNYCTMK